MYSLMRSRDRHGLKPPAGAMLDRGNSLARGLIACYLFSEGAGSQAVNAVPGQPHGAITTAKYRRQGLLFGGSDQVLGGSPSLGSGDFAFEAIVVLDTLPGAGTGATIAHTDDDAGSNGFELIVGGTSGKFQFWLPSPGYINGTTTVATGVRYHVCLSRLNGVATLYVNGVAEVSASSTASASGGKALTIGYFSSGLNTWGWTGVIEHARLWSRGLTAGEVARLAADPYGMFLPLFRAGFNAASTLLFLTSAAAASDAVQRLGAGDGVIRGGGKA